MWNAGLDEAGIKIAGRNINRLRNADDTNLMAESEEELHFLDEPLIKAPLDERPSWWKSFLMNVNEESEKVGLKLSIKKTKVMASSPITSWQVDGETVADFIFLGSKITADSDCSHKIKDAYSLEGKLWPTSVHFSSAVQSCPTLCDPMNQHTRAPCPSPTPGIHSSRPSSWWCHPAISSSVIPFSSCPQIPPSISLFQWVNSLHEVAEVLEFQLYHQSFQRTPRTDLL